MKEEIFIRISRDAKKVIGESRFATVALEFLIRAHDYFPERFQKLTEEAQEFLDIVMNDTGRSRLILPRDLRYRALARVAGNSRLLKALLYVLALRRVEVLKRYKEMEYGLTAEEEKPNGESKRAY